MVMPWSHGRQGRRIATSVPLTRVQTVEGTKLLLDVRSAAAFARGFVPGSISIPNLDCLAVLAAGGALAGRELIFISEYTGQIPAAYAHLVEQEKLQIAGMFGPELLSECQRAQISLGQLEEITPETLAIRVAAWNTTVVDTRGTPECEHARISDALQIPIEELKTALWGLPLQTALVVICETGERASLGASLLWNVGFEKVAFLKGGLRWYQRLGLPLDEAA
jgi:hydroxyacylglutathione hydrolase